MLLQNSLQDMHLARLERLCRRVTKAMELDLTGMRVLTEAATGAFAATAALAAYAGADEVVAVSRDSRWGAAAKAFEQVSELAERLGVRAKIIFEEAEASKVARGCDLVTNLGFVRPIDRKMAQSLSRHAAISLMWEPWEFRPKDIDVAALAEFCIPVIATNEAHPEVRTFDYLGPTVGRLLLDAGIEIVQSHLILVGSDPFGEAVADWLIRAGAGVERGSLEAWQSLAEGEPCPDAVILVEHRDHRTLISASDASVIDRLASAGAPIIRLCGLIEMSVLRARGATIVPDIDVAPGVMAVTTAHSGSRPVVDLHAAGLKAGSIVVHARQGGANISEAVAAAVASGYGLPLEVGK